MNDVAELASRLRSLVRPAPKEQKWLVIADTNLYIRAVIGHIDGPNRRIVEAGLLGVITIVSSQGIRDEVLEVLCREEIAGLDPDVALDLLEPIWAATRLIDPAPNDQQYVKVVRDPDDVIVLRTAAGIYFHEDLAACQRRYIVSGDTHAFPPGRDWYGFRYLTAREFMELLVDA